MRPALRRLSLVLHVGTSVGWIGAVAASLPLGVIGLTADDPATVRAAYQIMVPLGWWALVPFSIASLLTGVVQAVGTAWGLTRHWWVLIKLLMNLFATAVLLLYMQTLGLLADMARALPPDGPVDAIRAVSPVTHGIAAIVLLVVALVLSVYKPRALTPWALRSGRPAAADPVDAVR